MKLSFVGSGNVANHLAKAFKNSGHEILSIYSRNNKTGRQLAGTSGAFFCQHSEQIDAQSEIVILAVPDDEIRLVAKDLGSILNTQKAILCHTSGTTDLNTLLEFYPNSGILYPVQSFSINKRVDISQVPFCVNGANPSIIKELKDLAKSVSEQVIYMDDETRRVLHIAAVFANNFSNYMYVVSEQLCTDAGIDFSILRPLILMTTEKIMEFSPKQMQTGPAKRKDHEVINEHLAFLESYPEYRTIYKKISKAIGKHIS